MSFEGVKINKLNGGLGRSNSTGDNIFAIVASIAALDMPAGFNAATAHLILQPNDMDTLGFTAAHDANKKMLVRQSIESFFTYAPEAPIYLIVVPEATPALIAASEGFGAILRAAKDIKGFGIIGTTSTAAQCAAQAEDVQAMINDMAVEHRLFDFALLAGKGEADGVAIADYPNLREMNAPQVSIVIGQDWDVAATDPAFKLHADIGSALGMLAVRQVNENLGSVNILKKPSTKKGDPDYPLSVDKRYAKPALSDGTLINGISAVGLKLLTDKGYIYPGSYEGYGGVFYNSSPTAVQGSSDYANIENNRVWNKAARLIRNALIPEVKGIVKKDPTTGYILTTTITRWSGIVSKKMEDMFKANEISGYDIYINPKQVVNAQTPLLIKAQVQVDDIVHQFNVDLGLTDKIV